MRVARAEVGKCGRVLILGMKVFFRFLLTRICGAWWAKARGNGEIRKNAGKAKRRRILRNRQKGGSRPVLSNEAMSLDDIPGPGLALVLVDTNIEERALFGSKADHSRLTL
jgi:hypothetical protein